MPPLKVSLTSFSACAAGRGSDLRGEVVEEGAELLEALDELGVAACHPRGRIQRLQADGEIVHDPTELVADDGQFHEAWLVEAADNEALVGGGKVVADVEALRLVLLHGEAFITLGATASDRGEHGKDGRQGRNVDPDRPTHPSHGR